MLKAIRQEWCDVTRFLCRESHRPGQIFLLSVGGEINAYFGNAQAFPGFPVAQYVNACHEGKQAGLAEAARKDGPLVFSVAELQGEIEYERFATKWVGQFQTDLVSLSHYTFHRDLPESLAILRRQVKPLGPFGADRLMLGEYGPPLESCNWNQAALTRWHDEILRQAYAAHLQFAFFYELADQPFVIKASGHHGLVGWSANAHPLYRAAWHYYQSLYGAHPVVLPSVAIYEDDEQPPPDLKAETFNLVLTSLEVPPTARAGQPLTFSVGVANQGKKVSQAVAVNFFVDDRLVAWDYLPPLEPGQTATRGSTRSDPRYVWKATAGTHRICAVIDARHLTPEPCRDDNTRRCWLKVEPAVKE